MTDCQTPTRFQRTRRLAVRALGLGVLCVGLALPLQAQTAPLVLVDPGTGASASIPVTGAVTHVVFFATWCPTCVDELDQLSVLAARFDDTAYRQVIVAVQNRQDAAKLSRFLETREAGLKILFDATGSVQKQLGADRLPQHILLDNDGKEIVRASSLNDSITSKLAERVGSSRRPRGR